MVDIDVCSVYMDGCVCMYVCILGVLGTVLLQCIYLYNMYVHLDRQINWLSRSWCHYGM